MQAAGPSRQTICKLCLTQRQIVTLHLQRLDRDLRHVPFEDLAINPPPKCLTKAPLRVVRYIGCLLLRRKQNTDLRGERNGSSVYVQVTVGSDDWHQRQMSESCGSEMRQTGDGKGHSYTCKPHGSDRRSKSRSSSRSTRPICARWGERCCGI